MYPLYACDLETGKNTQVSTPKMPKADKGTIVVAVAPLSKAEFDPDVIIIYGNPAQIIRCIQGALYKSKEVKVMSVKKMDDIRFEHLEMVCHDPDACAKFMQETMGAELCEQEKWTIPAPWNITCRHVQVAGTVFQYTTAGLLPESWHKTLATQGNMFHNVAFKVTAEEAEAIKDAMLARGAKLISIITPPGGKVSFNGQEFDANFGYWIDATEQCGLRFEIITVA